MRKRGPQLRTVADVAAFLAKITREVYRGELDRATAGTLGYLCAQLRVCLETADLEARVEALEAQLETQCTSRSVALTVEQN